MAIRPQYGELLGRLPRTVPVRELAEAGPGANLVALRHDVDYDLDLALEMAWHEQERGYRATYYLLHTAPYWEDDGLARTCLQFQDFGHEVGLHLNALAEWMRGEVDDLRGRLLDLLGRLRAEGADVVGTAAHGDPLCYERQFINYWCLAELRPDDPAATETGLSAEGIPAEDEADRIEYPSDHKLRRPEGPGLPLWSVSMAELGLTYDATHVQMDGYYTDSGGHWVRSPDPAEADLTEGRYQVLVHPVHWRGPQRIYFFLSTARSGSKWLVRMLEEATPLTAHHEFSLNHRFDGETLTEDKRTGPQFRELEDDRETPRKLLREARRWVDTLPGDYAEANVYLERFPELLNEVFSDALLVHLHRDPREVVRSILNRRWYETPEDRAHPAMNVLGWRRLSQFEKACWYVRRTNERLLTLCDRRLVFKRMVEDERYLAERLRALGIPLLPRLASPVHGQKVNAARSYAFPPYDEWTPEQKQTFHHVCDPVNRKLGYPVSGGEQAAWTPTPASRREDIKKGLRRLWRRVRLRLTCGRAVHDFASPYFGRVDSSGVRLDLRREGLTVWPTGGRHAWVLVGGKGWRKRKSGGWVPVPSVYYRGTLQAELADGRARLFCLSYGAEGHQIERRLLGIVRPERSRLEFTFKVLPEARRFALGVFMPLDNLPSGLRLIRLEFEAVPMYP